MILISGNQFANNFFNRAEYLMGIWIFFGYVLTDKKGDGEGARAAQLRGEFRLNRGPRPG